MTGDLELLKADIQDELTKLERLSADFAKIEDLLQRPESDVSFYDRAAVGYYLHSFYNGCENVFRTIARFFENEIGQNSWHTDLLKRMKLEIPEVRPAVIDEECFLLLDDFRGFRHKFRHSYTFELDWEKERLVAGRLQRTFRRFQEEITLFLQKLSKLES